MLRQRLMALTDPDYRAFMVKLLPNVEPESILGVRTPALRRLAGKMEDRERFLDALPHSCFEEDQLHCFLLEGERRFDTAAARVDSFLPYVNNWATCDQLRPSVFGKNKDQLLSYIRRWLQSSHPYTIRFGMEMLMLHYLERDFSPEYPALTAAVEHDDYYVKMMQAWYFATALAFRYDDILPYLTEHSLEKWVHNKTIQKAVESRRLNEQQKAYLRTLRRK